MTAELISSETATVPDTCLISWQLVWLLRWQGLDDVQPKPPPRRKKPTSAGSSAQPQGPGSAVTGDAGGDGVYDIDDEDDDFKPVSVDMNAVKNLLHSYEAQQGRPGPTSNILGGMGVRLPPPSPPDDI